MTRPLIRAAVALALVSTLGGCGVLSLIGGGKPKNPAQLYRFGGPVLIATTTQATTDTDIPVQLDSLEFQSAAEGDRLLAVSGAEAFYIANSRWVSPADELFTAAAARAFDRAGLQLVQRGQAIQSNYGLSLTVPAFETRYDAGPQAAPTVVVEVRAAMLANRLTVGSTRAAASVPAAANTVTAIVAAYDAATLQTLDNVAAWAAATARSAPRPTAGS